jgi:hypothetical protein
MRQSEHTVSSNLEQQREPNALAHTPAMNPLDERQEREVVCADCVPTIVRALCCHYV